MELVLLFMWRDVWIVMPLITTLMQPFTLKRKNLVFYLVVQAVVMQSFIRRDMLQQIV